MKDNMKDIGFKLFVVLVLFVCAAPVQAWHDQTHLSVAKIAGFSSWYNAAGPDVAKIKAGNIEAYNHWFNNNAEAEVTPRMVFQQIERYNERNRLLDAEGHLYGAIIASLRAYEKDLRARKYAQYHLAYCAHYIADLSQPLHNIPHDDFNIAYHAASDGIVEKTILHEPQQITQHLYAIRLSEADFEADLAREISRIANISRKLGYKLRADNRNMTKEEAYLQLGHSVSLLQAVLRHYRQ